MFGFLLFAALWLYISICFFVYAVSGEAIFVKSDVGAQILALHGKQFKGLKTDEEIAEHIERNKKSIHEQNQHFATVGVVYLVDVGLFIVTAIYGFFSRLWQIENSVLDTQLRLKVFCERTHKLAKGLSNTVKEISECVDASHKSKMTSVAKKTDDIVTELAQLSNGMSDLPAVGFRKGKLLFFKGKPSLIKPKRTYTRRKKTETKPTDGVETTEIPGSDQPPTTTIS